MEENISNLSRHERRKLRRQQRRGELEVEMIKKGGRKNSKIIVTLIALALVVVLYVTFRNYSLKDAPLIVITPVTHDFGVVSQAKGIASASMKIENKGKSALVINNVKSNCGCTTASIIFNGIESPVFGMHNNPRDWSVSIEPGQTAELKINYNPNVHKDLRGPVTRMVTLDTNDPRNREETVRIDAYQTD